MDEHRQLSRILLAKSPATCRAHRMKRNSKILERENLIRHIDT